MAKKMHPGLVALSSAAILSVYGAGYVLSQPAAVSLAAGLPSNSPESTPGATSTPAASATAATSSVPSTSARSSARAAAPATAGAPASSAPNTSAQPSASAAASSATTLKDGTYTGSGTSRHGGVNVSVTIQNGRITAAPITSVTTRYSQNVIAGLPAAVVGAQSARVNAVSGATDSSSAYMQAVQQALAKASGTATTGSVQVTGPQGVIYSN